MGLRKNDLLTFTREEKKEIDEALNNVLDDINELWKKSSKEEIYTYYSIKSDEFDDWRFSIDAEGIRIRNYPDEYVLEQFKKIVRRPKIKNYTVVYYFLKKYDGIRTHLESSIISANKEKGLGIQEIIDIKNKYAKEATIEVDLPQTLNSHSIDIREENGRTIGEIKMGYGAIRIITMGPITVNKGENSKLMKK